MKNVTPHLFSALVLASAGLLYCGGDDTNSGPTGATGSSTGSNSGSGGSTGTGTSTGSGTTSTTTNSTTTSSTTTNPTTGSGGTAGSGGGATSGGGGGATGGRGGRGGGGGGAGGAPGDGGACPATPQNGNRCMTVGEVCTYLQGALTCTCEMGGNRDTWNCTGGGRDGGFMFDGGRMRDAAGGG